MSTDLEAELRAAFEGAGESVAPPADLVDRVRLAVRRKLTASAVAAVVVLAAAAYAVGLLVAGTALSHPSAVNKKAPHLLIRSAPGQNVDGLAVSGRYLYLATDDGGHAPYGLAAYNRETGRPIVQIGNVPSNPGTLISGPGGSVWLTFYSNVYDAITTKISGPCGTWLLSANLDRRSATMKTCSFVLLPTGPDTALVAVGGAQFDVRNSRLVTLAMPPPGRSGRVTVEPYGRIGAYTVMSLAQVGAHVAALVTNVFGDTHVVIAGDPGLSFGGGSGPDVTSEAAEANGLWVVTSPNSAVGGSLVRLTPALRPITPTSIKDNPILRKSERVWSAGHTVWVATASAHHRLVCFAYRSAPGPMAAIPVQGQVVALAAEGDTVYVTLANYKIGHRASDVYSYPIPPQCR